MDDEKWFDVKRIFQEAAELPPVERESFLARACGDDADLRAEVESLLECHEAAQNFMEDSAVGSTVAVLLSQASEFKPDQQIGPYRLIRELGHGGMGVVFLAIRDDVGKQAAIKVLTNASWSPARARFASEQRTLAAFEHPFIARLYDAGVLENGTPWFAMEYVEGTEITKYCRGRSIEECLKLFRLVCEAVEYAHGQGVIHRDLKPSNILVTHNGSDATPKLLDFGIAKQLDITREPGGLHSTEKLLTAAYAAPEQFEGLVSVQTDVYSLGLILYELIAGRPPFDFANQSPGKIENTKRTIDPDRPSRASREVALAELKARQRRAGSWADLDVLCLKAMNKDMGRRYKSVEALRRDIDSYLESRPLEARGDSLAYKLNKFANRHRVGLVAAAIVLALGIGWGTFFTLRLARARNEALRAASQTKVVQRFMANLFTGEGDGQKLPSQGSEAISLTKDSKVVSLLEQGVRDARSLVREPEIQAEIYHTLGNSYRHIGLFDEADTLLQAALAQRRTLFGADHPQIAETLVALGQLRIDQVRLNEGEQLIREGLEKIMRAQQPDKHSLVTALTALGKVLSVRGDYNQAISILQDVEKLYDVGPAKPDLLASLSQLADANFYAGHYEVSETLNRRIMAIAKELYNDRHVSIGNALNNLAAIQLQGGKYKEAEQLYRQGLIITEGWYGREHPEVASNLIQLAQTLTRQERYDEAEKLLLEGLAIDERAYPPTHPRIAFALNELGDLAYVRSKWDEAEKYFLRAAELNRSKYGEDHFRTITAMSNVAAVYYTRKDYPQAEKMLREVVVRFGRTLPPDHLNTGIARLKLARTLMKEGLFIQAETEALSAYEILMKQKTPEPSWVKDARKTLVAIYEGMKEPVKAKAFQELLSKQ